MPRYVSTRRSVGYRFVGALAHTLEQRLGPPDPADALAWVWELTEQGATP